MLDSHHVDSDLNRLRWACRRGMLELDLLLLPFFEKYYIQLSIPDQTLFKMILEYPDPELYAYLIGEKVCDDPKQQALFDKIRYSDRSA